MIELNEPHPALGQTPRQQAVRGVSARLSRIRAVQLEGRSGSFERSVSSGTEVCMRNAISYCAMRVVISGSFVALEFDLVQLPEIVDEVFAQRLVDSPRGFGDIQHRVAHRAQLDALISARQKAAAPLPLGQRLTVAA